MWQGLKKIALFVDGLFEKVALWSLVAMILIVTLQVFTRDYSIPFYSGQRRSHFYC
jgi:TRAP-type C4-dicarboxylate transport system permease small subunit